MVLLFLVMFCLVAYGFAYDVTVNIAPNWPYYNKMEKLLSIFWCGFFLVVSVAVLVFLALYHQR